MKKLNAVPVTSAESLEILKKREKEGEMGYEQSVTKELLSEIVKIRGKDVEKLREELEGLGFLKDWMVVKIIDILPATPDEAKAVFEKMKTGLKKQDYEKIAEIVSKYA